MPPDPPTPVPPAHRPLPRVCVALSGDGMAERAANLLPHAGFFEFRLDTATDPQAALQAALRFLHTNPGVAIIATCRRLANGGRFTGSAQEEVRILQAASQGGATVVDLSIETAEDLQHEPELEALRNGPATLLLSWHDFHGTPDLEAVHARIAHFKPGLLKIVPTATSLDDALRVLNLLSRHREENNLIAMAMGTPGIPTRVLGPLHGSRFTFAAPDTESATAPGQIDLHTLTELYRIGSITPQTRVYGVFGSPVTSSKSPIMLNAAFATTGHDAVYLPLQAESAAELFRAARALHLHGASVTMPLKETIVPFLQDRLSPLARTIATANTLVRRADGQFEGHNTDAAGITDPLSRRLSLKNAHVLVLGAGGAARAAVFGLRAQGAEVSLLNRSADRAKKLAQEAGASVLTREQAAATRFHAIVHATPHGMRGQQAEAPLEAAEMQTGLFFDLVYNPLETPLLLAARERGIDVIPGLEMFLAQGAAQFTLWTGEPAPAGVLREAVLHALRTA